MFFQKTFCDRLRLARKRAGFTTAQVGQRMYTSQSVISRYESGAVTPKIDQVVRMADLYGCSVDWLCDRKWDK